MGIFDKLGEYLVKKQQDEIDTILKADADQVPETPMEQPSDDGREIGRKAIIDDPFFEHQNHATIARHKPSRLSNRTLKNVSLRDWLVSAIIQIRLDTLLKFSRPQKKKFDMGYRIVKRDDNHEYTKADREMIANIENFIYHCGRTENVPDEDKLLFGEFLKLVVRDALTFGYISVEKVQTRGGALHRFRPLPAENVFLVNRNISKKQAKDEHEQAKAVNKPTSDNDPRMGQQVNEANLEKYKYIQKAYDGRTIAVFGDEDMVFKLFNPQNFADSMGYCYGPLELAIINITNHLNSETYNSNFFTHGYAARGILHLKGTVTQSQLTAFRRQFYNTISGVQHAWRTPIVAGLDDVDWVPMTGNARDMEYINYNQHLMRAICTQFQIDPIELGMDFLTSATGRAQAAGQQGNKQKIEYSRERGLYPILMFIEDFINHDILPMIDKELSKKYLFKFEGYTDETPQTEVALLQAQMTVNKTMNDLLDADRKERVDHPLADLPLNESFWALVEKNMTKGEIREFFMGDKGATERKELQYFPGDQAFFAWQQQLAAMDAQKRAEAMQQQQLELAAQEQAREDEAHKAEMDAQGVASAHAAVSAGKESLREKSSQYGQNKATYVDGKPVKNPLNTEE